MNDHYQFIISETYSWKRFSDGNQGDPFGSRTTTRRATCGACPLSTILAVTSTTEEEQSGDWRRLLGGYGLILGIGTLVH